MARHARSLGARWAALPLAGTACWTSAAPAAPAADARTPAAARCRLDEVDVTPAGCLVLRVAGRAFAARCEGLARLVTTIDDTRARVELEEAELVLRGDVRLDELTLAARDPALHQGWVAIRAARPQRALGAALRVVVDLPRGVAPPRLTVDLPCDALSAREPPALADDVLDTAAIDVGVSTPLRRVPGGPPIATLAPVGEPLAGASPPRPLLVDVLARQGSQLRVRVDGANLVEGWIDAGVARPTGARPGLTAGLGHRGLGAARRIACPRPVRILVDVDGAPRVVGRFKAGARFTVIDHDGASRLRIDLGVDDLAPYVLVGSVAACARA